LAEDAAGNLYGTTYFGGNANDGVVFKFGTGGYSVLHQFCSQGGCTDGSEPAAAVTLDAAGDIFGTAGRGGDGNYGVVFEIANGRYKRVYSFCAANGCSDGGYPLRHTCARREGPHLRHHAIWAARTASAKCTGSNRRKR